MTTVQDFQMAQDDMDFEWLRNGNSRVTQITNRGGMNKAAFSTKQNRYQYLVEVTVCTLAI